MTSLCDETRDQEVGRVEDLRLPQIKRLVSMAQPSARADFEKSPGIEPFTRIARGCLKQFLRGHIVFMNYILSFSRNHPHFWENNVT